ncbi:hypothetical protein E4U14_008253 [Claviceps sp. LM454 group G7]|nr:hypothetical protein E4U14_008253 [Claviceps sp. LM454 group G7]
MFHLQEVRNRTFIKKRTIRSAWEKSGLIPCNPSRILDELQDALSSLTTKVKESNLPGYVEAHKDVNPSTPPTSRHLDWSKVATPPLSIPIIQNYHNYVDLRVRVSIEANAPLTPSVQRVHMKARKAGKALEINGIAAAAELRRLQEKSLKRQERDERTLPIVAKWGPISVLDARLRAATDENNRREAQEEEKHHTYY